MTDFLNPQSQPPNPEILPNPSSVGGRNRLALLIGKLLARVWLRRQAAAGNRIEEGAN